MQAQARAQTTGVALNHFRAVVAAAAALGTFLFFVVFGVLFLFLDVPSTSSAVCPRVGTGDRSVYREREEQVLSGIQQRARQRKMFMEIQ